MSHVTFRLSHVTCNMWNAYVDPLDMLNNFCFLVYAQKWVFVIMSHFACHMSHCLCQMSHCAFHMSCVKCLCWSLVHSEQLLFSCVSSKVSICNYVTCRMSHVICQMLMLTVGTCRTSFVFISMLKIRCLGAKIAMDFLGPQQPHPILWEFIELVPS